MLSTISGSPCAWAASDQAREVDDVELRVADRLGEHEARLVVGQPRDRVRVVRVGEAHLDAVLRQRVREEVVGAAVERRDRDDVVAGAREVEHGVRHGRLARGRRAGREAALERRDALLEDVPGRVHDPRVDVARHLEREEIRGVLGVVELVRRRLVDRHGPRVRRRVGRLAGVKGDGLCPLSAHLGFLSISRPGNEKGPPVPEGLRRRGAFHEPAVIFRSAHPGRRRSALDGAPGGPRAPVAAVSSGQFPRPLGMTVRAGA